MLRVVRTIINALVVVSALLAAAIPAQSQMTAPNPAKVAELKMVLRDLYVNHIFWVRSLVIAARLRQSAAAKVADEEGMGNAKEIGQSITPYYGQAANQVMAIDDIGKVAWSDEADMWNAMVNHIYTLTGTLAEGTAKEFPEMFR